MYNSVDNDFIYISFDRNITKKDPEKYLKLKNTIELLSNKYGVVLYDDPDVLSEEEGIRLTKRVLDSKKLKLIIFAVDENLDTISSTSLKMCLDFCAQKDVIINEKNEKKSRMLAYEAGFRRLLISLSDDPANLIKLLNQKYNYFYNPENICYKYDINFNSEEMFKKIATAIDSYKNLKFSFIEIKQTMKVKQIRLKEKYNYQKVLAKINKNKLTLLCTKNASDDSRKLLSDANTSVFLRYDLNGRYVLESKNRIYNYSNVMYLYYALDSECELWGLIQAFSLKKNKSTMARFVKSELKRRNRPNKGKVTFISYSHRNDKEKEITNFANELKTAGVNIFFDNFDFVPGNSWVEMAQEVIESDKCNKMICVISPEYIESEACKQEIEMMLNKFGSKLYFYDPKSILENPNEKFKEYLKNRKVKNLKSRKQIIGLYNKYKLNKIMKKRTIISNYDLKEAPYKKKLFINKTKANSQTPINIIKEKKEYYVIENNNKIRLTKCSSNPAKFFINNEKIKIYESKFIQKEENASQCLLRNMKIASIILCILLLWILLQESKSVLETFAMIFTVVLLYLVLVLCSMIGTGIANVHLKINRKFKNTTNPALKVLNVFRLVLFNYDPLFIWYNLPVYYMSKNIAAIELLNTGYLLQKPKHKLL